MGWNHQPVIQWDFNYQPQLAKSTDGLFSITQIRFPLDSQQTLGVFRSVDQTPGRFEEIPPWKLTYPLKNDGWFRCISYWNSLFFGDMLVFRGVWRTSKIHPEALRVEVMKSWDQSFGPTKKWKKSRIYKGLKKGLVSWLPSREGIHILPGEKENHRLKYVSFQEG